MIRIGKNSRLSIGILNQLKFGSVSINQPIINSIASIIYQGDQSVILSVIIPEDGITTNKVEYYMGTTLVATANSFPWSATWNTFTTTNYTDNGIQQITAKRYAGPYILDSLNYITTLLWNPRELSGTSWWQADYGLTYDIGAGLISQKMDLSGNGDHFVQASASAQPIRTIATGVNGHIYADYDADSNYMDVTGGSWGSITSFSVFHVARYKNGDLGPMVASIDNSSAIFILGGNGSTPNKAFTTNGGSAILGATDVGTTLVRRLYAEHIVGSDTLYVDGVVDATGNSGDVSTNGTLRINGNRLEPPTNILGQDWYTTIFISSILSSTDRTRLFTWAEKNWG